MQILIVSQYFWPEVFTINELSQTLVKQGLDIDVLTGIPNYPEGKLYSGYSYFKLMTENLDGINIFRVPIIVRGIKNPLRLALNYLSFIVSASIFGPFLVRSRKIDVILVYATSPLLQAIPAFIISKFKKIPVILYIQDLWPDSLNATGYINNIFLLKIISLIVKIIYRSANSILISSRPFEPVIKKYAPNANVKYIPNSVSSLFLNLNEGIKINHPELTSGFVVMFAGNVGAAQAVNVILDAAEKITEFQEIKIIILGSGSELEFMRYQKEKRGIKNLHLLGRFPLESMPHMMSQASVLLLTLTARPIFALTVPNKTQAYLAIGKPIIAAINGEVSKIITDAKAGIAVSAEDSDALALAIVRMYKLTESERMQMGLNAKLYFLQNFEQSLIANKMVNHFTNVVRGKI